MKKLLSFLVAGIAALGLASCSGDLHNELDPNSTLVKTLFDTSIDIGSFATFELAGEMQGWDDSNGIAFEKNDDGLWEADFVAPDTEECAFCYLTEVNATKGSWNGQIGGDKIEADSLPDGVKYEKKDNGFGGWNAVLTGLTAGKTYKMTVDASTGVYVFSIEIAATAKPTPYILSGYFVAGNFSVASWTFTLKNCLYNYTTDSKKNVYYTLDTGFASDFYGFRLSQAGWSGTQIGNKELTVGEDYVELDFVDDNTVRINSDANCILSGANTTDFYRIYIKTTPDKKVYAKVAKIASYSLKVVVTGLPDSANDKTAIFAGTFNDWPQWTSAWGKTGKVSDHVNAVIISNEADLGVIASGLGNIGESVTVKGCGYYGTATADDIATADGEIKIGGSDVVIEFELTGSGSYTATIDLENDEVTVTKD